MCGCICVWVSVFFARVSIGGCVRCVSWDICQSLGEGEMEGTNMQQDRSTDHTAEHREQSLRVIQSIMLNYTRLDADLVALIMLHIQPSVSHKQRRLGSVTYRGKKEKTSLVGNGDGRWRHPLTWLRAYCVLLIVANKPITENICFDNVLVIR